MIKVNQVLALNQILKSFSGNRHVDNIVRNETKLILFKQFLQRFTFIIYEKSYDYVARTRVVIATLHFLKNVFVSHCF